MSIVQEGSYYVNHDLGGTTCLGIESARRKECVTKVQSERISGVFGSPSFGFKCSDLDFLSELPWLEVIWFWDINLKNVKGLYALHNLRYFGIHPKRPAIDFSRLPNLREVVIEPKPHDQGLGTLSKLELLHLWHFHPKDKSFASLELPESITELQINWANATSLESLPTLPALRRLEVHRCRNLESLGDLASKFPNLEHLVALTCGRISEEEGTRAVGGLPKLTHAYVGKSKLI